MGKKKCKCYAVPKGWISRKTGRMICDGCVTNSTKCPFRDKARDNRQKMKNEAKSQIIDSV